MTTRGANIPIRATAFGGSGKLGLNPIDTVDAIDEEDEDEDESDLESILELGDKGVLGDEAERNC